MAAGLDLRVLPGALAVAHLDPRAAVPAWASAPAALRAVVHTEAGLTGVLAALAVPLAEAGVPIFAVATYDTDHLLVRGERLGEAVAALRAAGHHVAGD